MAPDLYILGRYFGFLFTDFVESQLQSFLLVISQSPVASTNTGINTELLIQCHSGLSLLLSFSSHTTNESSLA